MAVSWVKELNRLDWSEDEEGNEQAAIEYEIFVDDYTTSIGTILAHASVPDRRSAHPENANALCISRSLQHVEGFDDLMIFKAVFSTKPQQQQDNNDPLAQLIKGGMRSSSVEVPAYYDALGYPLVNDAGDLFGGVTRKSRRRTVNVTANFAAVPDFLFQLSDTINAASVTILNKTYPAWTCLLTNVNAPDEPTTSKDGVEYWPITYDVEINPEGYWVLFPNKGLHELAYQTCTNFGSAGPPVIPPDWTDKTYAQYTAESDANKKQIIKRRIVTVEQQEVGDDIWLNQYGQAVKVISLTTSTLAGGAMTAGSATLTVTAGLVDATHKGCLVVVPGAGLRGKRLVATITAVASGTSCTLSDTAKTSVTGKAVSIPGARFKAFQLEEVADWSSVPLPNNHP